ncbi:hypothetical protein BD309DRAFT_947234 [Dichomitus squalens]|nr:uncharacterized protein DICSQDRAFT_86880 [Dichomitus squalens LYAD-421 SS1]EJF61291.1 hypothetical protein DICSQDRAFT_86880 [Dichomitus squalens LYAD-421 SS1]TBU33265.1 hypothetical protein BD311DRAFT_685807 [Dichomitus squalens]TBU49611.1 hypothetical protein BD309DRAFT_947234 [Dichomitus squalens]
MPGMLVLLSFLASLLLSCLCFPSVWALITGGDEFLDAHEAGLAVVASRTPFRESGPPACMAKLIMLRHKLQQDNTRRRSSTGQARRAARTFNVTSSRTPRNVPWGARLGRAYGKQNY